MIQWLLLVKNTINYLYIYYITNTVTILDNYILQYYYAHRLICFQGIPLHVELGLEKLTFKNLLKIQM
jgi:hypothetical protein